MKRLNLYKANNPTHGIIPLPGSKSESNRALLVNALCKKPGFVENLATARDTEIMQALLASDILVYDAQDAGTVMRFMTAYLSVKKKKVEITGTEHMKKRPIGVLIDALRALGVTIDYQGMEGYPPLEIIGLEKQSVAELKIASNISSQYISALLMIAPCLPNGLTLGLTGEPVSTPYIDMTVSIMKHFGVNVEITGQYYSVKPQDYIFSPFKVESDWSGASYWYSIFALSDMEELKLKGLKENSYQGDSVVAKLMDSFGVATAYQEDGVVLSRKNFSFPDVIDFIKCPDLAQTFAVLCTLLKHKCTFLGLKTLKIKETDRILALKTELQKIGADFIEENDSWILLPAQHELDHHEKVSINTYDDHRMAMAFAALSTKMNVEFDNREVVNKSYPTFWKDLESIGFNIQ